jgi:hypothetical protein
MINRAEQCNVVDDAFRLFAGMKFFFSSHAARQAAVNFMQKRQHQPHAMFFLARNTNDPVSDVDNSISYTI